MGIVDVYILNRIIYITDNTSIDLLFLRIKQDRWRDWSEFPSYIIYSIAILQVTNESTNTIQKLYI